MRVWCGFMWFWFDGKVGGWDRLVKFCSVLFVCYFCDLVYKMLWSVKSGLMVGIKVVDSVFIRIGWYGRCFGWEGLGGV